MMVGLGPATRVYLAAGVTDIRKSFDGLHGLVRDRLAMDPLSGHLFCFCNRRRTRLKLIYFDGSGLWVATKRLERGCFRWPEIEGAATSVRLGPEEWALLVGGLDLRATKPRRWWRRAASAA